MPRTVYQQASIELEIGDVVVIYSDGVTDARNAVGELYDTKNTPRLRKSLQHAVGGPVQTGQTIVRAIHEFSAGCTQFDDITLICFGPVGFQARC